MSKNEQTIKQITVWVLWGLMLWLWVQFLLIPKPGEIKAVMAPPSGAFTQTVIPPLSQYHMFGSAETTETSLDFLAQETSLDLIVTGIFASDDPQQGWAYIRSRQGEEKKFKAGDDVFGLATLDQIKTDQLVLKRQGGKQETLSLSKNRISGNTRVSKPTNSAPEAKPPSRVSNHIRQSANNWQETLNQQKYDPTKIAQMARNLKVVRNGSGQINGLRVSSLTGSSDLTKLGLRNNDQIVAVNGIQISNQNIITLQQQLQSKTNATVTIKRNGRNMDVNLNLADLK